MLGNYIRTLVKTLGNAFSVLHYCVANTLGFDFCLFEIVIETCAGVGKSCLLLRFSDGSFTTSFITTIGSVS